MEWSFSGARSGLMRGEPSRVLEHPPDPTACLASSEGPSLHPANCRSLSLVLDIESSWSSADSAPRASQSVLMCIDSEANLEFRKGLLHTYKYSFIKSAYPLLWTIISPFIVKFLLPPCLTIPRWCYPMQTQREPSANVKIRSLLLDTSILV